MAKEQRSKKINKLAEMIDEAVNEAMSITEDTDYSYDGMSFHDDTPVGDYGGHGGGGGGRKTIGQIFFDPAKDIAKTAQYAGQYLTTKVKNSVASLVTSLVAGLLPYTEKNGKLGVSRAFNHFNKKEIAQLSALDKTYGKYLSNNIEALKNSDVIGLAFLLNPKAILASKLLSTAPGVSVGLLDILTGGGASQIIKGVKSQVTNGSGNDKDFYNESTGEANSGNENLSQALFALAKNPEFIKQLNNSPVVKKMQQDGVKLILNRIRPILLAKTLQELSQAIGQNLDAYIQNMVEQNKIKPEEKASFGTQLMAQMKEAMRQQYIKGLEAMAQSQPDAKPAIDSAITQILAIK